MSLRAVLVLVFSGYAAAFLWPQGIVHYAINKKDYDVHSQEVIADTFSRLQSETCLKFFSSPGNYTASPSTKILYISNPDKAKDCPSQAYNFHASVVDMRIGYRCLDERNISRIVLEMLRASIEQTTSKINSFDLINKFRGLAAAELRSTLLTPEERNYINSYYFRECGSLTHRVVARRAGDEPDDSTPLCVENQEYYKDKIWPLGVVMYAVHPDIPAEDPSLLAVQHAMTTIELHSCVVFQPVPPHDQLETKNFLWLGPDGEDLPALGFQQGNQSVKLSTLAAGAPGHAAHPLHALLRALGLPMMSNRYDRDNYVRIDWKNVMPGKEHYLERAPAAAWLKQMPYDMWSATHAPANYMCRECDQPLRALTVLPLQDHLWQNTLRMGRSPELTEGDQKFISYLYGKECYKRYHPDSE